MALRKSSDHLSGKWEFPGGKIEPGDTPEECLGRQLKRSSVSMTVGKYPGSILSLVFWSIFGKLLIDAMLRSYGMHWKVKQHKPCERMETE